MPSAPIPGQNREWEDNCPFYEAKDGSQNPVIPEMPEVLKMTKSQKIEFLRETGFDEATCDKLSQIELNVFIREYYTQQNPQAQVRDQKLREDATMGLSTLRKNVVIQILKDLRVPEPEDGSEKLVLPRLTLKIKETISDFEDKPLNFGVNKAMTYREVVDH